MGMYPSADLGYGFVFECEEGFPPAWMTKDKYPEIDPAKLPVTYEYDEDYFDLGEALDCLLSEQGLDDMLEVVHHGNAESGYSGAGVIVTSSHIHCWAYDVKPIVLHQPSGKEHKAVRKVAEFLGVSDSDIGWRLVICFG